MKDKKPTKKTKANVTKKDEKISSTKKKWLREEKAVKSIQLAFDVAEEVQYQVRREALDAGISPSDRIREILGFPISSRRIRPMLTISLSSEDFSLLAERFDIDADEKLTIKQKAAEVLVGHVRKSK